MADVTQLLAAYLVVGKDEHKATRAIRKLRTYVDEGFQAFNLDEREASSITDAQDLLASLNTYPVGPPPRIVIVRHAERLPKDVSEALVAYLGRPNPSTVLLLQADTLAKTTRLHKAVAAVGPKAVIDCSTKKRWQLPKEVVRMARAEYGLAMDQDAAEELVSRAGESTTMLAAQMTALAGFCRATGRVTLADVEAHVARTAEVKPWDLLDAVAGRDAARALELYGLMTGSPEILLTSLVAGRVRDLVCAKSLEARGQSGTAALAAELGKKEWQVKGLPSCARRFSERELADALCGCAACDRALKSWGDPRVAFTQLVVSVCGTSRNP